MPVPRSSFPSGLSAEFFASPDWTGKAVATTSEKSIQYDWQDLLPVPALHTHNYSVRWLGKLRVPAAGKYSFTVSSPSSFPYSPKQSYRVSVDGKVVSEGVLTSTSAARAPGASPTAPPVMSGDKKGRFEFTFPDTQPHDLRFEYSHSENPAGGGVTLSWNAPADAQLTEAVNAARNSDVVVAFVGLSPELEGEEMPIKIQGFEGGDRTSINLPQSQQRMLEALSTTGKPLVVVNLSGSAVALEWANQHASAILQAWYPGVAGGTAIARTLAGANNPAGRLPVTFYSGTPSRTAPTATTRASPSGDSASGSATRLFNMVQSACPPAPYRLESRSWRL